MSKAGDIDGFDLALLAILVCPLTRTPLRWDADTSELVSEAARLAYPVRRGVPMMIAEEARRLDAENVGVGDRGDHG